ncbi:50S ribosomal protein L6 [Candidatus Shikimatogenerans bostrichidophilus]|uniref:50S ribosomal protein L6 n=1 Tax=Candidatus Shikimatogenerans bostrichidophilus TaxID=2943807 RepID=UPI002966537F
MSRIGKKYIIIPNNVNIYKKDKYIYVKGKLGNLKQKINNNIIIKILEDKIYLINKKKNIKKYKSLHGLYRMLIYNMIKGVNKGYNKKLKLVGVGYNAIGNGQILNLNVGYSHKIVMKFCKEINITTEKEIGDNNNIIINIFCINKQLLGIVASKIRSLKKPEPYKGKGIRYINEKIIIKKGKSV